MSTSLSSAESAAETDAALERTAQLLLPEVRAEVEGMAAAAGLSVGAYLRRMMDSLDPDLAGSVRSLDTMARRLDSQSRDAMASIEQAGVAIRSIEDNSSGS